VVWLAIEGVWVGARGVLVEKRAADFVLILPAVVLRAVNTLLWYATLLPLHRRRHQGGQGHIRLCVARHRLGCCKPWWVQLCVASTRYGGEAGKVLVGVVVLIWMCNDE
jgi:hypothetical protein